jgi:hypothetical protein
MTTASATTTSQPRPRVGSIERARFPVLALGGIYVLSVIAYAVLASRQPVPNLFPDEIHYGELAQSFAAGNGLTWRGHGLGLPPLWPLITAPAWATGSLPAAYELARVEGAALASLVVIPVWLCARALVDARVALIPAALSVLGSWMHVTSLVASENLAYPLAVAALMCTVMAVRDVRPRWIWLALGFGVLAALTRLQLLALPVALVIALGIDVLRQPKGARRARFDARPRAITIGLATVVLAGLIAFVVDPRLTHYDVLAHHVSIGTTLRTIGQHSAVLIVAFAFVPVAALVALMCSASNWRDERVGPVLVTFVAATVVLVPLSARFEAWATAGWPIERYTMYVAPLALLGLVLAPGRVTRRAALASAVGVALVVLAAPISQSHLEQPGLFGLQHRLADISSGHLRLLLFLLALIVLVAAALALTSRRRNAPLWTGVGLVALLFFVQSYTSQSYEIERMQKTRDFVAPNSLDWVDRGANGPAAILALDKNIPMNEDVDLYTEFFNRKIKNYYSTLDLGRGACHLKLGSNGSLTTPAGRCTAMLPRNWVIADAPVRLALEGQRVITSTSNAGTLVRVPAGAPKVVGLVEPPCSPWRCTTFLTVALYIDKPGRLAVRFGPGAHDHRFQTGNQVRTMTAGRPTSFELNVPGRKQVVSVPVDWNRPNGAPKLESVQLTTGGTTTRLY